MAKTLQPRRKHFCPGENISAWAEMISPYGEKNSPRRKRFCQGEKFSPYGENISAQAKTFPPRQKHFFRPGENFTPYGNNILPRRKRFRLGEKFSLYGENISAQARTSRHMAISCWKDVWHDCRRSHAHAHASCRKTRSSLIFPDIDLYNHMSSQEWVCRKVVVKHSIDKSIIVWYFHLRKYSKTYVEGHISLLDANMRFWQISLNNICTKEINRFKIIPVI